MRHNKISRNLVSLFISSEHCTEIYQKFLTNFYLGRLFYFRDAEGGCHEPVSGVQNQQLKYSQYRELKWGWWVSRLKYLKISLSTTCVLQLVPDPPLTIVLCWYKPLQSRLLTNCTTMYPNWHQKKHSGQQQWIQRRLYSQSLV